MFNHHVFTMLKRQMLKQTILFYPFYLNWSSKIGPIEGVTMFSKLRKDQFINPVFWKHLWNLMLHTKILK